MPLITAKNDRIFKTIIADNDNFLLMNAVLSDVLQKPINIKNYIKNDLPIRSTNERTKMLDVIVAAENEYFIIEINTDPSNSIRTRNFNYCSSFYSQNTIRGEKYDTKTMFTLIDLSYNLSPKAPLIDIYSMRSEKSNRKYVKNFRVIEVNIDKLKKMWYSGNTEVVEKYRHLLMLDIESKRLLKKLSKGDELVKMYQKKLEELNEDAVFVRNITPEEDAILIENTIMYDKGYDKGVAKGIKEGKKIQLLEIAKNLLSSGFGIDVVAKNTGLSKKILRTLL